MSVPASPSALAAASRDASATRAALFLLLLLLAVLPYANTLANGFVYDDYPQLVENPYVRSFRHVGEIFGTTVWSFQGAQGITNYYRPLMTFGYLLCYQLFGPLPYGFHLANLLLHAAVVLILFAVTRRLFGNAALAFLAAALFALHPVHTESVAWVAGVTDIELTLCYLLAFWFFLRLEEPGGTLARHAALAGSFVLALLSKEQALTLPLLATLYEHFYRDDRKQTSARQKASRYAALWVLAAAYLVLRARFLGGLAPVLQRPNLSWPEAFLSALALVGQYLGKLLWPLHLCAFYVFHKSSRLSDPPVLAGVFALLVCAALFALLWRRAQRASFALLWMLLALAPVLNARWMAANVFAERYLYLPSVGFCWLAAWACMQLCSVGPQRSRMRPRAVWTALAVVVALYGSRTLTRNRDWHDELTFCTRTLQSSPDAYLIRANLGTLYWNQGHAAAAEREWKQAYELGPSSVITLNNLGVLYTRQKRYVDAILYLQKAIALKPNYAQAHLSLGLTYQEMGLAAQAESEFRRAVELAPLNAQMRNYFGNFLFGAGRFDQAEPQFLRAAELDPTAEPYDRLGDISLRRGQTGRAEQAFLRAAQLNPFDGHAHIRLGALYASHGRIDLAVREYRAGLETDPANAEALAALRRLNAPTTSPAAPPPAPPQ